MGKLLPLSTLFSILIGVANCFAFDFLYLSPGEMQGHKLFEGDLDRWNFAEVAPAVDTYAPVNPLDAVLVDSLRSMGAKVLVRVEFDPSDSPDYFRLRAGFKSAFRFERDGVYLPQGDKLPPPYDKALSAAREDAAFACRMRTLAEKLIAGENHVAAVEGRRALRWIAEWNGYNDVTADDLRLETGAWIYHLESVLGLPHSPAPKEVGSLGPRPSNKIEKTDDDLKYAMKGKVQLDQSGLVSFDADFNNFRIAVADQTGDLSIELYLGAGETVNRYDFQLRQQPANPRAHDLGPRAPFVSRGLMNGVSDRFDSFSPVRIIVHDVYSDSYPDICLNWSKGVLSGNFSKFGRLAPMTAAHRVDRWRIVVRSGEKTLCDRVITWNQGGPALLGKYRQIGDSQLKTQWDQQLNGVYDSKVGDLSRPGFIHRYANSTRETNYHFVKTPDQSFQIGDPVSDNRFWNVYAKEIWGLEPTPERFYNLGRDLLNARRKYLKLAYAGGPFKDKAEMPEELVITDDELEMEL